jgi:F-type H+-transporting ATPase subunit delta
MKPELSRAGHQYAMALFEIASEQKTSDKILVDLQSVNATIESIGDFGIILNHPAIPVQEKKKLLVNQFGKHIQELTMRLIEMLVDRRRMELVPYIVDQYRMCLEQSKGIVHATLTSAHKISNKELASIKKVLTKKLGKEPELEVKVDPTLIAGMQLAVGDQILDGSVKTQLANIERSLLSV